LPIGRDDTATTKQSHQEKMTMFAHASRLAKTIGLAAGIVLIGGSLVGGIALAADRGDDPTPGVTGTSLPAADATTGDRHDDDDNHDDVDQVRNGTDGGDDCDEGDSSDGNCSGRPTTMPSSSQSHHDDNPNDDDPDDRGGDD
jgi:hypothetical protein